MDKKLSPGSELDAAVQAALVKMCNGPVRPECFSTDWKAAGCLVEWLAADGWKIEINREFFSPYEVILYRKGKKVDSSESSFPHALSLAALAAMEAAD